VRSYRLTLPFIVLCALVAFYACSKYKDAQSPTGNNLPEEKIVTASMQGRVLDENGDPVQGAAVTSGTASTTTDENGVFNFSNISMSSRFGFVKVVKQGYFTGSRSVLTAASSSNFVSITLIPRAAKGTFGASGGGFIEVGAGDTVSFDASSVVNAATHAAYTGTVHVYSYYLDPLAADAAAHMPGDLRGIDTGGKETLLRSFGMMVVELDGDGGEKLQIAPGKQASLSMKIPDALKATAPATIPLWYFNDTTGRWVEQGVAVKKGGQYCGQTSHFTWWNCDAPTGAVNLTLRVKDQHGNPLVYTGVAITSPTLGTRTSYTDEAGYITGLIPKGEVLQLKVISSCGSVLAGANVGPALADQDLGTLTVTNDIATLTLSGTVVDCNGAAVDSGFVSAVVDGLSYRGAVRKGAFTVNITRCLISSTTAMLIAGNYGSQQQGSSTSLSVDTGKTNAGQLTACGTSFDQFVSVTVNNSTYALTTPPDSILQYVSGIASNFWATYKSGSAGNTIAFSIDNLSGTGTYTPGYMWVSAPGKLYYQSGTNVQCTVTKFGNVDDFIQGTFSGQMIDSTNQARPSYPITGSFKVRRTQ